MSNIQVLFLHHLDQNNNKVVENNFNSFLNYGNDIIAIRDADQPGLPNSHPVTLNGAIPRGSRRWATDTVLLNYVLENKNSLKHNFYMFCEYDCYCKCNLDIYCEPYLNLDICVPHIVNKLEETDWLWFKSINLSCSPLGFRPSVFILFSRKALIDIAEAYVSLWGKIGDSNSEARLGSIANLLGMKIGTFKDLGFNVSWYQIKFKESSPLYHPVKSILSKSQIIPEPEVYDFIGSWEMGRNTQDKFATIVLEKNGTITNYKNYNEVYWSSSDHSITIYNGAGGITTKFENIYPDGNKYYGNYYDGNINGEKILLSNHHWIKKII